ncbi:hypothetical protein Hdeb2414_s0028g00701711 [Helianthus debilis subsp. tardiflorus]
MMVNGGHVSNRWSTSRTGGPCLGPVVLASVLRVQRLVTTSFWVGSSQPARFGSLSNSHGWSRGSGRSTALVRARFLSGSGRLGRTESTRSKSAGQLSESTRLTRSTQSAYSTFRREDLEYCRMHASESHLGNDIIEVVISYLCTGIFRLHSKARRGWNRMTMKSRLLSGVHFQKDLNYLLPLCNEG